MYCGSLPPPFLDGVDKLLGRSHAVLPWQEGARALVKAPLLQVGAEMGVPQSRLDEISALAAEAVKPQSGKSRAQIYGRFLAACSDCHRNYKK